MFSQSTISGGKRRCFGEYYCANCRRNWMSASSWEGFAQKCEKCNNSVYAHRYSPLEKPEGLDKSDPEKSHPSHLCEKCKSLGFACNTLE